MKNVMELAASESWIAVARKEGEVEILENDSYSSVANLKTNYDFGGQRLAISDSFGYIFVANYYTGIECIGMLNNNIIWRNKSIKNIQKVIFFSKNNLLLLLSERSTLYILNCETGTMIDKKRGIIDIFQGLEKYYYVTSKGIKYTDFLSYENISAKSGTILAICSTQWKACVSEIYEHLKCIDLASKKASWISSIPNGYRFNVLYTISNSLLSGVGSYTTNLGVENYLFLIDFNTGIPLLQTPLSSNCHSFIYVSNGTKLICSNGDIYDTLNHQILFQIK